MSQEITKRQDAPLTPKQLLDMKFPVIVKMAGGEELAQRIVTTALLAIHRNKDLLKCQPMSILDAALKAAEVRLDCAGGTLGQGYLVPFGDEAVFIPGYRGLIDLARQAEGIEIEAQVVYAEDEFEYEFGTNPHIRHVPRATTRDNTQITHAYMVAWIPGARHPKIEVMTRDQIEKVKAISKRPGGLMWSEFYEEACRKTVVRRGCKYLPMAADGRFAKAIEASDEAEFDFGAIDQALAAPEEHGDRTSKVAEKLQKRRKKVASKSQEKPAEPPAGEGDATPAAEPPPQESQEETPWDRYVVHVARALGGVEREDAESEAKKLLKACKMDQKRLDDEGSFRIACSHATKAISAGKA